MADTAGILHEWSRAIQRVDIRKSRQLLHANPDLLWTPLSWDPDRDASHVISQLYVLRNLGASLDNLCAIPYTLIQYYESGDKDPAQVQTADLLVLLIDVKQRNFCVYSRLLIIGYIAFNCIRSGPARLGCL